MYNDPAHMHQQQSYGPNQNFQGYMHQQQSYGPNQNFQGYLPQQRKNPKGYAVASLILFIIGGLLHILALIPAIGILFGCMGLLCDCVALIFLIMVVASL